MLYSTFTYPIKIACCADYVNCNCRCCCVTEGFNEVAQSHELAGSFPSVVKSFRTVKFTSRTNQRQACAFPFRNLDLKRKILWLIKNDKKFCLKETLVIFNYLDL